jgi:serine/threonine-protein kinase
MDVGSSDTRAAAPPSHPVPQHGFSPGTVLAGRYRIVALVGRGGMGEVYRADDLTLGQPVALKFLPSCLEHDPAARERLLAEVRNARTVSHPNVCRVYDIDDVDGRAFLTMEYIDGEDLASLLRRIGRLPAPKALAVARQLCAGLAAAHDKGVLHRDLKPANVMIDGRGQARITDFGLAVAATSAGTPGDAAGTVAYMAPERFTGRPATVQSDLYALGLILYETCTGHAPFKASTIAEWQHAHSSSTPSTPSSHVSDIEPAVELVILRCLEKDPARRPASAAQVAAALPGGDPLAAAIAAGETPSPELVAASGQEGTLPRWQAWAWLAACLLALVLIPLNFIPFRLTEHVSMDLSPDALQARARETLRDLGYGYHAGNSAWWFRTDDAYLERVNRMRPSEATVELRTAVPGPLVFCFRQSPAEHTPLANVVTEYDPAPEPGDAYVELDLRGRLVTLRVKPPLYGEAQASSRVDWTPLFAAAHLGAPDAFAPVPPAWWPDAAVDVREAREGMYCGQKVRVEAAARSGRAVFFRLLPPWIVPPAASPSANAAAAAEVAWTAMMKVTGWFSLVVLAGFAYRNLRLGRGDRTGARRLSIAAAATLALSLALESHASSATLYFTVAVGLFAGFGTWVCYLGFEPAVRRTWPHLLIASTRLLDLRWRDPLVGRALLAGVLVGLIYEVEASVAIHRLLNLPAGAPTEFADFTVGGAASFLSQQARAFPVALVFTSVFLGLLFVVRLIARRTDVAWVVYGLLFVGWTYLALRASRPATMNPLLALGFAALFAFLMVWLLWKHGALAFATGYFVTLLTQNSPWTLDMSRWYAWRQWVAVVMIAALAIWGFRNVLGKQSAFPSGALDG